MQVNRIPVQPACVEQNPFAGRNTMSQRHRVGSRRIPGRAFSLSRLPSVGAGPSHLRPSSFPLLLSGGGFWGRGVYGLGRDVLEARLAPLHSKAEAAGLARLRIAAQDPLVIEVDVGKRPFSPYG